MPEGVRVLRLGDMVLRRGGSPAQRLVQAVISVALRLFFRRIETSRAGLVPESGALIFVINHPNGLIDPGLVFAALPRRISFLAKSTLFRIPVAGWLLRTVEALPLYRRADAGEDVSQNLRTFEACRRLLLRGRCIASASLWRCRRSSRTKAVSRRARRCASCRRASRRRCSA